MAKITTGLLWLLAFLILSTQAQAQTNNAPTGRIVIQRSGVDFAGRTSGVTSMVAGTSYSMAHTTGGGNLADADSSGLTYLSAAESAKEAIFAGTGEGISWQRSADGTTWTESKFGHEGGGTGGVNLFRLVSVDLNAAFMRVCLFYIDGGNTLEGGDSTSATTRAAATSQNTCSVAVSGPGSVSVNNPATGAPTITYTTGHTAPTVGGAVFASGADIADADGRTQAFSWQWSQANTNGGTYTDIVHTSENGAGTNQFFPRSEHVGKFLQVCASFTDDSSNAEKRCLQIAAAVVAASNTAATGRPSLDFDGSSVSEDEEITASTRGITDRDGINASTVTWQWQSAPAPETGIPANDAYTDITGETSTTFTPGDAEAGRFVRVCVSFTDMHATPNDEGPLCSLLGNPVFNVNDAPDGSIAVNTFTSPTSTALTSLALGTKYEPSATTGGGSLTDADGHPGQGSSGRFSWQRSADDGTTWTEIKSTGYGSDISYTPVQADATAGDIRVCHFYTDGQGTVEGFAPGVSITGPTSSDNQGTVAQRLAGTICTAALEITGGINNEATGMPAVAYADGNTAPTADSAITASGGSGANAIADADGLGTFSWQWSVAASNGGTYTDISGNGADSATFTPQQAHVGQFLQVCASFTDRHGNSEGPLCTQIATAVANVNDAPTGAITIQARGDTTATTSLTVVTIGAEYDVGETTGGGNIADPNGNPTSLRKSWQRSSDGTTWTEAATFVTDGGENSYTVVEDDRTAGNLRACVFFTDGGGNAEGGDATSAATRASTATICAPTISTFNDAAVAGAITAADNTDLAATGPNEENLLTAANPTDAQGVSGATFTWQWAQADTNDGVYTAISGATNPTFTPLQEHVGKFLRVCASFTDEANNGENACTSLGHAVVNVNDAPSGRVAINTSDNSASTTALTALTEGTAYSLAATTGGGTLADPDGLPTGTAKYIDSGEGISWQTAATANGPWTEVRITSDHLANGGGASYTPTQAQVDGYVRVCLFYNDGQGTLEGGNSSTAATRVAVTSTNTCSVAATVANVNDAPTASDGSILLQATETHTFTATDFPFSDDDSPQDSLASVIIETVPTAGTLANDGTTLTGQTTIDVADIGNLVYTPSASASVGDTDAFTFNVIDDGSDGSDNKTSTNTATISITIIVGDQAPASGAPTVTASDSMATAHNEDVELAASTSGITDNNGIDIGSLQWQWYSAAAPATGTPADGDYSPIAGADEATFTPLQAQVGMYIRVCVRFNDGLGNAEGPFCSTGAQVANVNDAPTSADATVNVFTTASAAEPYTFKEADFPYMDEDGDSLASITIVTIPASAAGTFRNATAAVTADTTVAAADLGDLSFYPPANTAAADNHATFTFTLSDGALSSATHTMTINLMPSGPAEASGQPAITGTAAQNATLTATRGTVADANGIDDTSIMWQWQQATAADGTAWADIPDASGADADEFMPTQAQVAQYVRVCITFMDEHDPATPEGPLCSAATGPITDVNDPPMAEDSEYQAARDGNSDTITIPASVFMAAYSDPDGADDMLESVTITTPPTGGILMIGEGTAATAVTTTGTSPNNVLAITGGEFDDGPLTFTITADNLQSTTLMFTLSDGDDDSDPATLTITFGKDIAEQEVVQASAILSRCRQ